MRCQDVLEMLSPYIDGVLSTAENEAVRVHLAGCPACRAEWEELNNTVSLLQELPEIAPPAGFRAGLMEKIDQLSAPAQGPQHKRWFKRVAEVSKGTWAKTAAVAAVMAMTLGLTSLWQKDGNQLIPIDPKTQDVVVAQEQQSDKNPPAKVENNAGENSGSQVRNNNTKPTTTTPRENTTASGNKQGHIVNPSKENRSLAVESFVPASSEGMVARNISLKLDVQDLTEALKSVGAITQANSGSINEPYVNQGDSGSLSISVPTSHYKAAVNELQKLGQVISYLPVEQDLSAQHKQLKASIEQLRAQKADLEAKLAEGDNSELQKQLDRVNDDLAGQIKQIQQIEARSNYSIIDITLI